MKTIQIVMSAFLEAQRERLKVRTYRDYESVIDLFQIYLNSYAYMSLEEDEMEKWKIQFEQDEDCFTKMFGVEKLDSAVYSDFLGYFIIRKVASGESFMRNAIRVIKKLTNWLLENNYIDEEQYSDLIDHFSDGKSNALPNAEKVSDLLYDQARNEQDRSYEKIKEDLFTINEIRPKELWVEDTIGDGTHIGPVIVSKQISDLCQKGWGISLLIGRNKDKWYIIESGNVYP